MDTKIIEPIKIEHPALLFTVNGSVEQKAATVKFTALSWYLPLMRKTYIVVCINPEKMQSRRDRQQQIKELIAFYHAFGIWHLSYQRYEETGLSIDIRDGLPNIQKLK